MFGYYFDLALRSFKRNKVLTALMVLAIALGIGAAMTTLTVFHVLSGDPLPGKSNTVFSVKVDASDMGDYAPGEEPPQMTRFDAEALLRDARGKHQAMMTGGGVVIEPERADLSPFQVVARFTSADFFPMFDVPLQYGSAWTTAQDNARARVAIISEELNDKLFDGANSVGRSLRLNGYEFRVAGVLADWQPNPHFYDLDLGQYGSTEQVFLPFSTSQDLDFGMWGNMSCWDDLAADANRTDLNAPCAWIQYWVQLESAGQADDYRRYLVQYAEQQRAAGRFERPVNVRLRDVMEWLDYNRVVPSDVRLQVWLAFGFLLVCLLNTVGLLLAKFLRRGSEIGVRRALGASRRAIFSQCLIEAGTIGLAGGLLGLALATLGLYGVRQQPAGYAELAQLDPAMLLTTFALALVASLLAGLLPAWHACRITPAIQLKSQ